MSQPAKTECRPERNLGLDVLKSLAMMMVVLIHIVTHGGLLDALQFMPAKRTAIYFLYTASFCAVNCYGLISGFVGVESRQRYSSLAVQHLRVVFYSVLITLIIRFVFPNTVSKWDLLKSPFPYTSYAYWYYTAYLPTALLAPFINRFLHTLTKKELCRLGMLLVVIFSLWPMVSGMDLNKISSGYSVWWILCLYVMGGILRLLNVHQKARSHGWFALYAGVIGLVFLYKLIEGGPAAAYRSYANFFFLAAGAALVLCFARITVCGSTLQKTVRLVSRLSFGVYLIHDHALVRLRLIQNRFAPLAQLPLLPLILCTLLLVLAIWLACLLIDLGRQKLFDALKLHKRLQQLETAIRNR